MKPRPNLATRADVVNPCARVSFWERCALAGAVDLGMAAAMAGLSVLVGLWGRFTTRK